MTETRDPSIELLSGDNIEWNWEWVSKNFKLSENCIRKFQDRVHWESILLYQDLSLEFLQEFKDQFINYLSVGRLACSNVDIVNKNSGCSCSSLDIEPLNVRFPNINDFLERSSFETVSQNQNEFTHT